MRAHVYHSKIIQNSLKLLGSVHTAIWRMDIYWRQGDNSRQNTVYIQPYSDISHHIDLHLGGHLSPIKYSQSDNRETFLYKTISFIHIAT